MQYSLAVTKDSWKQRCSSAGNFWLKDSIGLQEPLRTSKQTWLEKERFLIGAADKKSYWCFISVLSWKKNKDYLKRPGLKLANYKNNALNIIMAT